MNGTAPSIASETDYNKYDEKGSVMKRMINGAAVVLMLGVLGGCTVYPYGSGPYDMPRAYYYNQPYYPGYSSGYYYRAYPAYYYKIPHRYYYHRHYYGGRYGR